MDIETTRKKSDAELKKELQKKREALREFRFSGAGGRTRNVREGRTLRKEIARIMTVLNERTAIADRRENA